MKLNLKSFAFALGIYWGLVIFSTGIFNLIWHELGQAFLEAYSSIYPGYDADHTVSSLLIGTVYATADACLGGFIIAWLYNQFVPKQA